MSGIEILGTLAAVLQLLTNGISSAKLLSKFKHVPERISNAANDIENLKSLFEQFQSTISSAPGDCIGVSEADSLNRLLTVAQNLIKELDDKVRPLIREQGDGRLRKLWRDIVSLK